PNHYDLASIYNNIGVNYALLGDHKKELEYCEKALEICKIIYADNLNENLSISYRNVGIAYEKIGEYQKALDYKLKSLEISEIINISQCKFFMLTLLLINRFDYIEYGCGKLSNPQKELEYCLEELKRQKEIANRDNRTNLYICYNRVGISYYKLGDYQNALEYFFKNLEIAQNMIADSQNSSAPKDVDDMVYINIGATYKEMGKCEEALEYLLKALEIRKTLYKDKLYDEVMIKNITRIAECYEALGNEEKAKEYYSLIKK
ncbi:MAG: tetratricopeptide repeat protein, partial [Clostridia bacterium]|nr:tetratricopeptide repeat protein [Clostridia bacterium]